MTQYSKILTLAPILIGLIMIALDYLAEFQMTQSQVQLIEFIVGGTILGGVTNGGFKKYMAFKEKQKNG